ncbi:radical SAM protein [Tabrizicola aquatica]|uniref:radical SAM protein n=1 Tax=Tabrizicola aquatica TaxID=909926 RepID=UPI000CD0F2E8|nr:radical SAM protein [Tabrizicola aquatica]
MLPRKVLVNIEPTPSCPAACSMCPRSVIRDDGFMSVEMMERIIDQVDPSYVWEIDLAGRGEPTIHPQFHTLLEIMRRPGITTDVTTTGVTFTQKNIDAVVNNVDVIRLSVSSVVKPVFDKVHIGLNYDRIWRNIAALGEAAGHKVYVHLTGGPVIYDSLPLTVEKLRSFGYSNFYLFPLWNRGGEVDHAEDNRKRAQLSRDLGIKISESEYKTGTGKVKFFLNTLIGLAQNKRYCPIGDGSVSISHKGDILGCFQDFGHVSNVGHIDRDNLRDIIRSRVRDLGNMEICRGCNSRKAVMPGPMFFA